MYKGVIKKEISKEKVQEILTITKNIVIFILLLIWFFIPIIKQINKIFLPVKFNEFIYLKRVGVIGLYLICFNVAINFIKTKKEERNLYLKQNLPIFILVFFMAWTLISCIFSPHKVEAFVGNVYRKEGFITYLAYAGIFSCAFFLKSKKMKKTLLNTFLIVAILNIIFIKIPRNMHLSMYFKKLNINESVFDQFNHYGYYLLLATMTANLLFIYEKNKFLKMIYLLGYVFLLYFLIFNNTFGCYLAMAITMIFFIGYSIFQKKKRCLSILSIIIFIVMSCIVQKDGKNIAKDNITTFYSDIKKIAIATMPKEEKNDNKTSSNSIGSSVSSSVSNSDWERAGTGRMKLWKNGIKVFLERPILGYGPENLGFKYEKLHIDQDRPHNLIIQLLVTSGIPGMLLYVVAIRNYCNKRNKIYDRRKSITYS